MVDRPIDIDVVKTSFLKEVSSHSLKILKADDPYLCLKFTGKGSPFNAFTITTFPGWLLISGDMGTYAFSRVPDLATLAQKGESDVDPAYWAKRVEAEDAICGTREFCRSVFRKAAIGYYRVWASEADRETRETIAPEFWDGLQSVACEEDARAFVSRYEDTDGIVEPCFFDFWSGRHQTFTHHFVWCCHAIVWGISKFKSASS